MRERITDICREWANETISIIQGKLESQGINATEELTNSFREEIDINQTNLIIWAAEHVRWVDYGRPPDKKAGTITEKSQIKRWMEIRGIPMGLMDRNLNYITQKIAKSGTLTYRKPEIYGLKPEIIQNTEFWEERLKILGDKIKIAYESELIYIFEDYWHGVMRLETKLK